MRVDAAGACCEADGEIAREGDDLASFGFGRLRPEILVHGYRAWVVSLLRSGAEHVFHIGSGALTDDVKREVDAQLVERELLAASSESVEMLEEAPRSVHNAREEAEEMLRVEAGVEALAQAFPFFALCR